MNVTWDTAEIINTGINTFVFVTSATALYFGLKADQRSTKEALVAHREATEKSLSDLKAQLVELDREVRDGGYIKRSEVLSLKGDAEEQHRRMQADIKDLWERIDKIAVTKLSVADYERERELLFNRRRTR